MPWTVEKSDSCPESRPWAVVRDSDGSVEGCHASEADANKQRAALYAQESLTPAGKRMEHKSFDLIEAKADADSGTFEALVSVFGNVDSMGDRIKPGAFKATLAKWAASGDPIPVILSHDWQNPWSHIGVVHAADAKETDRGLLVKGHLDVKDNEVARQVHRLMSRRSLKEFSFGYNVVKETRAKDGANDLLDVDLIEIGPTLKGANPATELHAVKSAVELENQPPPRSETEIRRELERHKIGEQTKDVPKVDPAPPEPPVVEKAPEPPPLPPPSETAIRRELDRHKADEVTEDVPEVETGPSELERLVATVEQLGESMTAIKGQIEKVPDPPSEKEIRQELIRHTVAEEIRDVPKGDPPPTPVEILSQHVEALTEQIGEMASTLDEKLKSLEKAVEEPKRANSVEQRFRSEATRAIVELDSDGVSFSKPPKPEPEPEREAEWSLKVRARREIYDLLND